MLFRAEVELGGKTATGIAVPDEVVTVPDDLAQALATEPTAAAFFDRLAPSHRKEWVRWIEEAKQAQTRASRLAKR